MLIQRNFFARDGKPLVSFGRLSPFTFITEPCCISIPKINNSRWNVLVKYFIIDIIKRWNTIHLGIDVLPIKSRKVTQNAIPVSSRVYINLNRLLDISSFIYWRESLEAVGREPYHMECTDITCHSTVNRNEYIYEDHNSWTNTNITCHATHNLS